MKVPYDSTLKVSLLPEDISSIGVSKSKELELSPDSSSTLSKDSVVGSGVRAHNLSITEFDLRSELGWKWENF